MYSEQELEGMLADTESDLSERKESFGATRRRKFARRFVRLQMTSPIIAVLE